MKTLQMIFTTDFGKSYSFNVNQPKENISAAEVKLAMEQIIKEQLFETVNGRPVGIKSAKLVDRIETPLL